MNRKKISFIGAGNMATALISGLLVDDSFMPSDVSVSDINDAQLTTLENKYKIVTTTDNKQCVKNADVIVLCIKPQLMSTVCKDIFPVIADKKPVIISIAAGITLGSFESWLGGNTAIVRAMPNTPSLINTGATGLYANRNVSSEQKNLAEKILRAVGIVLWLASENEMNYVTALSGSGPAYFFRMMESLEDAAVELGLDKKTAHLLTLQTALGAAKLAMESDDSISELRKKVTSPGGTTEQGLRMMQAEGVDKLFKKTLQAASQRAEELSIEYGEK